MKEKSQKAVKVVENEAIKKAEEDATEAEDTIAGSRDSVIKNINAALADAKPATIITAQNESDSNMSEFPGFEREIHIHI